ncbi:hypothetical protein EJ110_NYTH38456 [Nymphaea thermarum]|nr:hypothetical protein EJ110_NYTH38456 [Nymphaea thermarum]
MEKAYRRRSREAMAERRCDGAAERRRRSSDGASEFWCDDEKQEGGGAAEESQDKKIFLPSPLPSLLLLSSLFYSRIPEAYASHTVSSSLVLIHLPDIATVTYRPIFAIFVFASVAVVEDRSTMELLQQKVETWLRGQGSRIRASWPLWRWPWPGGGVKEERRKIQEEYRRRKQQLQNLCRAVRAESLADLQDILCAMVLSECVYKVNPYLPPLSHYLIFIPGRGCVADTRPASEVVRIVNKFKADFGGQVVSLDRVQPSLDHVPHRYLLAEAGDTLFASFIGTKQYKDIIADANILQGAIFHEDVAEDVEVQEGIQNDQVDAQTIQENPERPLHIGLNTSKMKRSRPAAHRGFLARAKGIPALELYRLAQRKNRKLVLCGHSLGGAVAVLATLAILRVVASSSSSPKENGKVQVKCITFSQPPVGNAALREWVIFHAFVGFCNYVHRKGWQDYFKTYCIPEDLVPRILSPAYFHHYSSNALQNSVDASFDGATQGKNGLEEAKKVKPNENDEHLILGLGPTPIKTSFWRLSRLVPLEGMRKKIDWFKWGKQEAEETSVMSESSLNLTIEDAELAPECLEIQEGTDGISLNPFPKSSKEVSNEVKDGRTTSKSNMSPQSRPWRRVPSLPSYVPFGQVRSVITELRERFQSHSMRSYRARFQKIYDLCMYENPPILGMEQLPQFPHLQQWLGLAVAGVVELGHIVEPPVIRTATSIVPLGWNGVPGMKNGQEPLKVDIHGYGLHLCNRFLAQVNGSCSLRIFTKLKLFLRCSTTVESSPSISAYSHHDMQSDLQKVRILIGAPLRQPPNQPNVDSLVCGFPSSNESPLDPSFRLTLGSSSEHGNAYTGSLNSFTIHCTSDFFTVSKEVHVRTRRVRLLGLEGAGKTSLYNAIMRQNHQPLATNLDAGQSDSNPQEGVARGLCYSDSVGVNLQDLSNEARHLREELWMGTRYLSRKTDLIVLVHNLSHRIPRYHQPDSAHVQPALSLLLNEATEVGVPWVLAITNIFSLSADQKNSAINAVLQAYQASPDMAVAVNSCPYIMPTSATASQTWISTEDGDSRGATTAHRLMLAPINFVRMPFQKKPVVLPVEGVNSLCQLVHRVLSTDEEASFEELARERLYVETLQEQLRAEARKESQDKENSVTAAAVGASLGAGGELSSTDARVSHLALH